MRRWWTAVLVVVLAGAAGCAPVPFRREEPVPLRDRDPAAVVERFRSGLPDRFRLLSSIVFEFSWNTVSALGITEVDRRNGTFTAVGMNAMGVKLFELSGDAERVVPQYVFEGLTRRGNAAEAIGQDIRRIYFDLVPSPDARVRHGRTRIVFREQRGSGTMEYVYAGAEGRLVEKRYEEAGEAVWVVRYYEYVQKAGKDFPSGIVLDNHRHRYRLVVRVKEIEA